MADMDTIHERIRGARLALQMTQEKLAARVKIEPGRLSEYETGRRLPSVNTLARIARAGHITTDYIIYGNVN